MNQASLYHKANEVQRHDAEQIIREYSNKLQWRLDKSDALLDIGTGSGDVLMDFIYPLMPSNFERVIGTDISPKMVDYAKNMYKSKEKCDFRVLDIGTENEIPNDLREQFDHVTSFYCLHWLQDQRQALENAFKFLRGDGGDCLLVFLAQNPMYDVYKILSKSSKWSKYMNDVDRFICPWHFCPDPQLEFSSLLKQVGFSDIQVELRPMLFDYQNAEIFKDNFKAINAFIDRIPQDLHDRYMEDITSTYLSLDLNKNDPDAHEYNLPYKLLIAYAKKPPPNGSS